MLRASFESTKIKLSFKNADNKCKSQYHFSAKNPEYVDFSMIAKLSYLLFNICKLSSKSFIFVLFSLFLFEFECELNQAKKGVNALDSDN